MKTSTKITFLSLFGLVWFAGIVILYYVSHKPFTPEIAIQVTLTIWRLLVALWLVSLSGGIGYSLAKLNETPPTIQFALQVLLGLGILGTVLLLGGSTVGISIISIWIVLIVFSSIFWRSILNWWTLGKGIQQYWNKSDLTSRIIALIICLLLSLSLLSALAPPTKWDALVYHLTMPEAYLQANRISHLPWIHFSGMPQLTEMLYTWAIAIGNFSTATTLGWMIGVLALLGILETINKGVNIRSAWVGVASLLSGITLVDSLNWGYVDWTGFAFGWASLVCLDTWRKFNRRRYLILAGIFTGFALGTKYTAGVVLLVGIGTIIWHTRKSMNKLITAVFQYSALSAVIFSPWLIKNWIATGNPLFPFFTQFFQLSHHTSQAIENIGTRMYQNTPAWGNWWDIAILPLRATYLGIEGGAGFDASIGPLLLGLGLFAWIGWPSFTSKRKILLETATIFSLFGIIIWILANQYSGFLIQTRLYFPIFPAFAIMAASGYAALSTLSLPGFRLSIIITALVLTALCLNLVEMGIKTLQKKPASNLVSIHSDEEYLAKNLGVYSLAVQEVKNLSDNNPDVSQQALMLFEPRSLYCMPICSPDDHLDNWKNALYRHSSPIEIVQHWKAQGYTHILYYKTGADFMRTTGDPHYNTTEWQALDDLLAGLPSPVDILGAYYLYTIP